MSGASLSVTALVQRSKIEENCACASEKVDRREIVKKIAKSCRPLISEDQFRNRGADIMLIKSSSVAKSRIGTFTKCQLNARIRRRRISRKRACARVKGVRAPKKERVMMIQKRLQPRISQNDK